MTTSTLSANLIGARLRGRLATTLVAVALSVLSVGCGVPVTTPTPEPAASLHRAALQGDGGANLHATFRLPARRVLHTAGSPALTVADLTAVTLYLVEAAIGPAPTGVLSPVAGSGFTYTLDASNRTRSEVDVQYTHVPANAPGMAYFLAVTAIGDDGDITSLAAPASIGGARCYVSSGGGDEAAPGSVRVTPVTYAIAATTPLAATLKLLDAKPVALQAGVTITDGGTAPGP